MQRMPAGNIAIPDPQFYNIPGSCFEVAVLVNLMNYLWSLIKAEFDKELNDCFPYIASLKLPDKEPTDYSRLNEDHLKMADEVAAICTLLKKAYYLKALQYILPSEDESEG